METLDNINYQFLNNSNIVQEINVLKSEIDSLRPIDKEQENRIMQKFRLDWNYNSNAIEGNSLDYGETAAFLMHGITAKGKPLKDYLDIKGHNEVIDYLSYLIKNKEELSERDIRSMHQMLLVEPYESPAQTEAGVPIKKTIRIGEYKRSANHVRTITGEIHYYASPEDTPILMGELMEWYRSAMTTSNLHPVVIASIFHHRFTSIHPFDDGNGRMSRLLMNLILMQYEYPPVIIKNSAKNDYYLTLSQADTGDIEPFVNFIGDNLLHSLNVYIRGARGESIEEQSDLKKKLTLFKKEVEARGDKVELRRSPEVLKSLFDKSLLPLINELNIVLSDFKDLFFVYEEKYANYLNYPNSKWEYSRANIIDKLQELFYADSQDNVEVVAFQFLNFKLAENSFSVELKLSFLLNDLGYYLFYSFSEADELSRVVGAGYDQWFGDSIGRRFYHQDISSEDISKIANKIGEDFYAYTRSVFDKEKPYKPTLSSTTILELWTNFIKTYSKLDQQKTLEVANRTVLDISQDNTMVLLKASAYAYSIIGHSERFLIEKDFFSLLNKESNSIQKIFVDMVSQ